MGKYPYDTTTDVLVLGAGLGGIRAALAAADARPRVRVVVAASGKGPQGSSFANPNNELGIQVCINKEEKDCFVKEAASLAPPGEINLKLTRIMAEESHRALENLVQWGGRLKKDRKGKPLRMPGCFSPVQPRAYIIEALDRFYHRLVGELEKRGIVLLAGYRAVDILTVNHSSGLRVSGAALENRETKERLRIHSNSVVLAMGGGTAVHPVVLAQNGRSALILHDWCRKHKISYVNSAFTQFVWCKAEKLEYWRISAMGDAGARFKDRQGRKHPFPQSLYPLFKMRSTHAPISWGGEDRAIDKVLIDHLDARGGIEVYCSDRGWERVVMAAQVSNGGIRIDENGYTGMPGLFACGEAAGGMHGADRIGGAMVLSSQVFGRRAGRAAAEFSLKYH
ncbi:MAG: FAD-binding protein [Desulfobacter sp.]|nr:MAG: FAD-binding protein [Desulfobacter sp.]